MQEGVTEFRFWSCFCRSVVQCSRKNSISLKTTLAKKLCCYWACYLWIFFPLKSLVLVNLSCKTEIYKWVVRDSHAIVGCNTVPGQFEIQDLRCCFRVSLLHAVLALVRLLLSESVMLRAWSRKMSPLIFSWQDTKNETDFLANIWPNV